MNKISNTLISSVALALLSASIVGNTQEVSGSSQSLSDLANDEGIEEVIVRAQRREQRAIDVPTQITTVSAEQIQQYSILTLEDFGAKIPNAFFSGAINYGTAVIALRGVGGSVTVFGEDPVAIYFDNQYIPRSGFNTSALLDVESIEILRGPQATLYGRNATGGAILLRSTRPSMQETNGYARVTIAEYGEQRYEAALGGPVSEDTFAFRVAGHYSTRDGWVTNTVNGQSLDSQESTRLRASALWMPSDRTEVFGMFEFADASSVIARARYAIDSDNSIRIPQSRIDELENGQFANDSPTFANIDDRRAVLSLTHSFDGFELVADTGYYYQDSVGATDSDGTGNFLFANQGQFVTKTNTAEVRLVSSRDQSFDWIVGVSAIKDNFDMPYFFIQNTAPFAGRGLDLRFFSALETEAYALYGEGTWDFADRWSFTFGARGTYEKKTVGVDSLFFFLDNGDLFLDLPAFADNDSWTAFKPRGILQYDIRDEWNAYFSISTGFKSGGYNAFGAVPAYDEENIVAYEVGTKGSFLDNTLSLSSAVFYYDYSDLQLRLGVPTGGVSITNAANAEITGFEAEATLHPSNRWEFFGSVGLLDTEFKDFITRDLAQNLVDASGNELSRAPGVQYTIGGAYEQPVGSDLLLSISGMLSHQDKVFFLETNQDSLAWSGEPITELDFRAALRSESGRWEVVAFVQNATDELTVVSAEAQGNFPMASFNEPRKYGLVLQLSF